MRCWDPHWSFPVRLITSAVRCGLIRAVLTQLRHWLRNGLGSIRQDGLDPISLRFIGAAVDRSILRCAADLRAVGMGCPAPSGLTVHARAHQFTFAVETARDSLKTSRTLADAGLPVSFGEAGDTVEGDIPGDDHGCWSSVTGSSRPRNATATTPLTSPATSTRQSKPANRAAHSSALDIAGIGSSPPTSAAPGVMSAGDPSGRRPALVRDALAGRPGPGPNGEVLDLLAGHPTPSRPPRSRHQRQDHHLDDAALHLAAAGKCAGLSATTRGARRREPSTPQRTSPGSPAPAFCSTDLASRPRSQKCRKGSSSSAIPAAA